MVDPELPVDDSDKQLQELLPWHKPDVQRLTVSLDTSGGPTSRPDFTAEGGSFQ